MQSLRKLLPPLWEPITYNLYAKDLSHKGDSCTPRYRPIIVTVKEMTKIKGKCPKDKPIYWEIQNQEQV